MYKPEPRPYPFWFKPNPFCWNCLQFLTFVISYKQFLSFLQRIYF